MDKETREILDIFEEILAAPREHLKRPSILHVEEVFAKQAAQTITRQEELIAELKRAMDDLLGSPMGTVPKSAEKFYDSKSGRFAARKSLGENNE